MPTLNSWKLLAGLVLLVVIQQAAAQRRRILLKPMDPMVNCTVGRTLTGVQLVSSDKSVEKFKGYDVDLLVYILQNMGWDPNSWYVECVSEDDMYKIIKNNQAFMGFGGVAITSQKMEENYDFSLPTFVSGLKLAMRSNTDADQWSFFLSFDTMLWLMILLTTILTGLFTWCFEGVGKKSTGQRLKNLKEMIWQSFSSLFYTSEIRLQKFSARLVFLCFWFMVLVLTATYTADLTTKLASRNPKTSWSTMDAAISQKARIGTLTKYRDMVLRYNLTLADRTYDWNEIDKIREDFHAGKIDGIALDIPTIDKLFATHPCTTFVIQEQLANFNYGFIYNYLTFDKALQKTIDYNIYLFKESPDFQIFSKKWINVYPFDDSCQRPVSRLELENLAGLWIILAGAIFFGVMLEVADYIFQSRLNKLKNKEIIYDEQRQSIQEILDSYLMVDDYIHIPSRDLHQRLEDDIKNRVDAIENMIKDKFSAVESRVLEKVKNLSATRQQSGNSDQNSAPSN
eukprot:TRINITY_DN1127_c0_g2_i1.p1 TRINITY_DN1127_c0_g2~~TRINITY_DN1127_c0_g2_i1.p1  ORF type:complete len:512 (+),score=115.68 TRINITY_DN1127_c0_g2_i1:154-1689(+)